MKDKCAACEPNSWAADDGSGCQPCEDSTQCPCQTATSPCFSKDICYNYKSGGSHTFGCLSCPDGYEGSGVTCTDINEVTNSKRSAIFHDCNLLKFG